MPGRPKVLDEVKMAEICAVLSMGSSRYEAAEHVGCAPNTIENTIRRDKAFAERVRHAETKAEMTLVRQVRKAAKQSWRAAAWALEHIRPQRYARRRANYLTFDEVDEFIRLLGTTVFNELPHGPGRDAAVEKLDKLIERFDDVSSRETVAERRKLTRKITAENSVHKETAWERQVREIEADEENRRQDEARRRNDEQQQSPITDPRSAIPNPNSEIPSLEPEVSSPKPSSNEQNGIRC